jgi:energy-coupling factor transporter ATP-binding protein EcfA2
MKLSVRNLTLSYSTDTIFENLSFDLNEGEILGIRGGNGSGKSSLCLCLAGLIDYENQGETSGMIRYGGRLISELTAAERCRAVGIIFQNPDNHLFAPLVSEELAFAPENLAVPHKEIHRLVDEALSLCRIKHLKTARTNALSGGEKQLVAIASVLTMKPRVLIADEITARIDAEKVNVIRKILTDYAASGGSVIFVSHSEKDLSIATKILSMERGKNYAY